MSKGAVGLLQGTLEFLILQALKTGDARHGFGVLRWIGEASDGALDIEEGALYPALHRLERKGWVETEWGLSDKNRRAKYYTLTDAGREELARATGDWSRYAEAVFKVLGPKPGS